MSYTKTPWISGETALSADNMNNIQDGIKDLENQLNSLFKIASYSVDYTVAAKTGKNITAEEFGMLVPDGYTPIAILRFSSGSNDVYVRGIIPTATGTSGALFMTNTSSSQITAKAYLFVLYTKTDWVTAVNN